MIGQFFWISRYVPQENSALFLGPYTRKKRTWPISSHLDRTSLLDKNANDWCNLKISSPYFQNSYVNVDIVVVFGFLSCTFDHNHVPGLDIFTVYEISLFCTLNEAAVNYRKSHSIHSDLQFRGFKFQKMLFHSSLKISENRMELLMQISSTDEALQLKLQVRLFRFPKFYCNNIYKYNWLYSIPDQFIRTPILFHTVDPANISIYSKILLYESCSNMFKETYSIYHF